MSLNPWMHQGWNEYIQYEDGDEVNYLRRPPYHRLPNRYAGPARQKLLSQRGTSARERGGGEVMIFVTAFDAFGSAPVNGSREAALCWAALDPEITVAILPVVRGLAWRVAQTALAALAEPPTLWLMLGEAGREPRSVRLEKVAINWDDFRLPDNLGTKTRDNAIVPGGPDAYFASLHVAQIAQSLEKKTPLPVQVSLSAGAFLCNHLAYHALHARLPFPTAFIHVPAWRPEDGEEALGKLVATLRAIKEVACCDANPDGRER